MIHGGRIGSERDMRKETEEYGGEQEKMRIYVGGDV